MTDSTNRDSADLLCQRCDSQPLFFRVRSEIIDIKVCVECGVKAASLGLIVTELSKDKGSAAALSSENDKESA
jgi:Zn ribbon nucleic-acid-binding protein